MSLALLIRNRETVERGITLKAQAPWVGNRIHESSGFTYCSKLVENFG